LTLDCFPDDVVTAAIPLAQREKRLKDYQFWIESYVNDVNSFGMETLTFDPQKISYLNTTYWETLESQVRSRMLPHAGNEGRLVDRHKIAAVTELATMAVLPIQSNQGDEEYQLLSNAKLAYALGLMIIGNFNDESIQSLEVSQSFVEQHIVLLCEVRANNSFAFFSNAAIWYLVERIFIERLEGSRQNSTLSSGI
jgi:hypothetical protein